MWVSTKQELLFHHTHILKDYNINANKVWRTGETRNVNIKHKAANTNILQKITQISQKCVKAG